MPRKLRPLQEPRRIELSYGNQLVKLVEAMQRKALPKLASFTYREDAKASRLTIQQTIDALRNELEVPTNAVRDVAEKMAVAVDREHTRLWNENYREALGIQVTGRGMDGIITESIRENVDLIKSIPKQSLDQVNDIMLEALERGSRNEVVSRKLLERFDVAKSRARLIARDQVGKLYGKLNAKRQTDAGVEKFEWDSSRDSRVRPLHKKLHGQIFSYAAGGHPVEGLPGQPIQCRCSAIPVVEGFE